MIRTSTTPWIEDDEEVMEFYLLDLEMETETADNFVDKGGKLEEIESPNAVYQMISCYQFAGCLDGRA